MTPADCRAPVFVHQAPCYLFEDIGLRGPGHLCWTHITRVTQMPGRWEHTALCGSERSRPCLFFPDVE